MTTINIQKDYEFPVAKSESWKMFNEISVRYDFLNRVLSFGMDMRWRRRMADFFGNQPNQIILDLATGTADVPLILLETNPKIDKAIGIDLAEKMLEQGRLKIAQKGLKQKIKLLEGDINHLPFSDNHFDCVTIAFGIRNVEKPQRVLAEMLRVLRGGGRALHRDGTGRALILEFSFSSARPIRRLQLFYLRNVVPIVGFLLSGHYRAYRYLNQTIEKFPYGKDFCRIMEEVGFKRVVAQPLFLGTATIYQGDKE